MRRLRLHHRNGALGLANDALRCAAEQCVAKAGAAVGAIHDEVGAFLLGQLMITSSASPATVRRRAWPFGLVETVSCAVSLRELLGVSSFNVSLGAKPTHFWRWDGVTIEFDADWCGKVHFAFVALSANSKQHEMRPLTERLSNISDCLNRLAELWRLPRPKLAWRPEVYKALLNIIIATLVPGPCAVVAVGHAATYALAHSCASPNFLERPALVAPT